MIHALKSFNFVASVVLASSLFLVSCSTPPTAEEKEAQAVKDLQDEVREEIKVGKVIAAKLAGSYGIYKNPDVTRYINLVGKTLAAKSSRPELNYSFAILDTDEINAFAAPGGFVFLTKGVLTHIKSEDELAGVIGHEIAHVTHKHLYDQIKPKKKEVSAQESLVRFVGKGNTALELALGAIIGKGMDILLKDGLSQDKEAEADTSGLTIAFTTGYNPAGLETFLKRLKETLDAEHAKEGKDSTSVLEKTHPPLQNRINALQAFTKENGIPAGGKSLEERYKAVCLNKMTDVKSAPGPAAPAPAVVK